MLPLVADFTLSFLGPHQIPNFESVKEVCGAIGQKYLSKNDVPGFSDIEQELKRVINEGDALRQEFLNRREVEVDISDYEPYEPLIEAEIESEILRMSGKNGEHEQQLCHLRKVDNDLQNLVHDIRIRAAVEEYQPKSIHKPVTSP